jgi:predicted GTPase
MSQSQEKVKKSTPAVAIVGVGPMSGKTLIAEKLAAMMKPAKTVQIDREGVVIREPFPFDQLRAAERRFGGFDFRPKKP